MRCWGHRVGALVVVVLGTVPVFAQGGGASSTGSITGQVRDVKGPLQGVAVTATGPATIGAQTEVTSAAGTYRFQSVPPGEYTLVFALSGFQTFTREGVRVGVGFNATVNVTLPAAAQKEAVTVVRSSPTIDTTAARVQTNFDRERLALMPNARDMWSLLAATPSITLDRVDVGGSTMGTETSYVAYGHSGQNRPLIEGINTTEGTAGAGLFLDYGSVEGVFVGAAGNSVEMPNPGVLTQFVSKSGSNRPAVSLYYDYEGETVQSRNLDPVQVRPEPGATIPADGNRLARYQNLNVGLSGPIVKDRLWAFYGYRYQASSVAAPPSGSILDGTLFDTTLGNHTVKGTYRHGQANRFVGYLQHGTRQQPHRIDGSNRLGAPIHVRADSTASLDSPSWVYKGEWNGAFGQSLVVEARAGQFGSDFDLNSRTAATRYESLNTNQILGGGRNWRLERRRNQLTGAASIVKDNFLRGSHTFKVGGEYLGESSDTRWASGYADSVIHFVNGDLTGPLSATTPAAVRLYVSGTNSKNALATTGIFVTDSWVLKRLTVILGARLDRYRASLPAQTIPVARFNPTAITIPENSAVVTFSTIVPRLGAIYDFVGDGKVILKGNWGRFYFNPGVDLADAVNPNASDQYSDYTWNDLNNDRVFQPGEQGVLEVKYGGVGNASVGPNLKNAYADEGSVFVEGEVTSEIGVRGGLIYKTDGQGWGQVNVLRPYGAYSVPVTVRDPGLDGVLGTLDDGASRIGFNLDDPTRGSSQVVQNLGGYEGTYKTIEVGAQKRYSRRYSVSGSYSYTWTREFGNTYFSNRFGAAAGHFAFFGSFPGNPNETTLNDFTNWNVKLSGTADAGWGVHVTPVVKLQSGAPYGRSISATMNYGSQLILLEPIGTRRQDMVRVVDVRVERQFRVLSRAKVGLFVDVFNVLNANTELNLNWRSGASFERPTTVLPPRIAKFGITFDW